MQAKLNKFILLVVLLALLIIGICLYQCCFWQFFVKDGQLVKLVLKDNLFANHGQALLVEVVKDESSTQQGLSDRPQLQTVTGQQLDGMLFIFPEAKIRYFWMKDMQFDIDICWFKEQRLLDCTRQVLQPTAVDDADLLIYQSPQAVNLVLETMPDFLPIELLGSKLYWRFF
jgi:uncharacterized membrane protein (UPF0127 family)